MHLWLTGTLALAAGWAIYSDFRYRRISNYLTFGAAIIALTARLGLGGPTALLSGVEGWVVGCALLFVPFALGWMGAGDVKLLAAFGALGGPLFVFQTALLGCLVGGFMSIAYLFREKRLSVTLRYLSVLIRHPFSSAIKLERRMPFGPALAAGAAASLLVGHGLV